MSGSNFLVDTNFLIYLLNGRSFIEPYLGNSYFISDITEVELLGIKDIDLKTEKIRTDLIRNCYLVPFNTDIKGITIKLKQQYSIKLPDAIVAACSLYMGLTLITADKYFQKIQGLEVELISP